MKTFAQFVNVLCRGNDVGDEEVVVVMAVWYSGSRKKPKSKELSAKRAKVGKGEKVKDPNMPKRPPTAFIVGQVGKEAGEKWRSMSDEEKKPYL
ncbi:hypothetical protein P8452_16889 [Trifolium repens]|nr:hypothetical protein P8452_16889 [Trifolium repens]